MSQTDTKEAPLRLPGTIETLLSERNSLRSRTNPLSKAIAQLIQTRCSENRGSDDSSLEKLAA